VVEEQRGNLTKVLCLELIKKKLEDETWKGLLEELVEKGALMLTGKEKVLLAGS